MTSIGARLFHVVLATIIIILMVLILNDVRETSKIFSKSNVCISAQCMKVNNILKSIVDKTQNPCQDFEKFVCGLYVKRKEKEQKFGALVKEANTDLIEELSKMLRKPIGNQDRLIERLAKQFHKTCMNIKSLDYPKGYNLIKNQILKLPKIPLLDSTFSTKKFSWIEYYKSALNLGIEIHSIVIITFTTIRGNERDLVLSIKKGLLEELHDISRDEMKDYILEYLQETGVSKTNKIEKDIDKTLDLHNDLAKLMSKETETNSRKISIKLLKKSCPEVDWLALVNIFYDENHKLNENDFIKIEDEETICEIQKMLKNRERELANHLFISSILSLRGLLQQFQKIHETVPFEFRSRLCLLIEDSNFPIGTSLTFMLKKDEEYGDGARKELNRLISEEAREELKTLVGNEATWISSNTRKKLLEKIDNIVTHIGYLRSNETISQQIHEFEDIYKDVHFLDDDPIHNCLQVIKARNAAVSKTKIYTFIIRVLYEPLLSNVIEPDAHFVSNYLEITYGIIFPLTYQHLGPASHNYGGMGSIGCHEFAHSLDPENYIYNASGIISDFWNKYGEKEYRRRLKCLVEEYNKVYDDCAKMYVDGEFTLSDNFADLVGMTVARRLLSKWLKKNGGVDLKLNDFTEYTPEQMFWIASSAFYCEHQHTLQCQLADKDRHNRGPIRINMNAKMSPYFAKDWKCDSGPMNPKTKCKVF